MSPMGYNWAKSKMKKLFNMGFIVAISMSLFTSCIEQPNASFSVSNTSPKVGESIQFYNNSIDAESYEWDFGDGTTSTEMSPSHKYYESGSRLVTMTAFSKNRKKSATASALVNVKATGDVMFWTDESTVFNITVNLENVGSKTITSYYYYIPSDCGASGCVTFNDLEVGTYKFTAENLLYYWSGTVTVTADNCKKTLLYHSKAEKQLHPESQSTERLIEGINEENL